MKTANSFVTMAVLGLAAVLAPVVAGQANPPQKRIQQTHPVTAQAHAAHKSGQQAHPAATQHKRTATRATVAHPAPASVKHPQPKAAASRHLTASRTPKPSHAAKTVHRRESHKHARTAVARKPTHPVTATVRKPVHPAAASARKPAPAKPAAAPLAARSVAVEPVISRRDPFAPLIRVSVAGRSTGEHLPPGVGGLVVATVRVDGTVESPTGRLAVVSNPDDRVYFVRVGDRLYDGDVEKISLDGVTFKENSKDAFGKPVERLVTKRIYPSAGE